MSSTLLMRKVQSTAVASTRAGTTFRRSSSMLASFFSRNPVPPPTAINIQQSDKSNGDATGSINRKGDIGVRLPSRKGSEPRTLPNKDRSITRIHGREQLEPLLAALRKNNQEAAWKAFVQLQQLNQIHLMQPAHFLALLKGIRPVNPIRFATDEVERLSDRYEQTWTAMLAMGIQPTNNFQVSRLGFYQGTRQYRSVMTIWTGIRDRLLSNIDTPDKWPTKDMYDLILTSCVKPRQLGVAMETISVMKRYGVQPDAASWGSVMRTQAALGQWDSLATTFLSVFATSAPPGDAQVTGRRLKAPLGTRTATLFGGVAKPSGTETGSVTKKLTPTISNINTLLSYYAYNNNLADMRLMFDTHVKLFNLVPSTRSFTEMIKLNLMAGQNEAAMDLFHELVESGKNLEREVEQATKTAKNEAATTGSRGTAISSKRALSNIGNRVNVGPDFNTFSVLIKNELSGEQDAVRAFRWMRIMQDMYGLTPSNNMFRRTLGSLFRMNHEATEKDPKLQEMIKDLIINWKRVRRGQGWDAVDKSFVAKAEKHMKRQQEQGAADVTSMAALFEAASVAESATTLSPSSSSSSLSSPLSLSSSSSEVSSSSSPADSETSMHSEGLSQPTKEPTENDLMVASLARSL